MPSVWPSPSHQSPNSQKRAKQPIIYIPVMNSQNYVYIKNITRETSRQTSNLINLYPAQCVTHRDLLYPLCLFGEKNELIKIINRV